MWPPEPPQAVNTAMVFRPEFVGVSFYSVVYRRPRNLSIAVLRLEHPQPACALVLRVLKIARKGPVTTSTLTLHLAVGKKIPRLPLGL